MMSIRISLVCAFALACASQPPPSDPHKTPPPQQQYQSREAGMAPGTWHLQDGMTREEAEAAGIVPTEDDEPKKPESGSSGE